MAKHSSKGRDATVESAALESSLTLRHMPSPKMPHPKSARGASARRQRARGKTGTCASGDWGKISGGTFGPGAICANIISDVPSPESLPSWHNACKVGVSARRTEAV